MSKNRSLRQTKMFNLPAPNSTDRHRHFSINLTETQRSNIFLRKADEQFLSREKSLSLVCERKLKARILEIIGNNKETLGNKNDSFMKTSNPHKYSRSYIHYKVICKEKTKDAVPQKSDTLMKIRSICERKLISLPQKQSICSRRKQLKELEPVLGASPKVKIFTPKNPYDFSSIKHCRTESYQVENRRKHSIKFEPWNSEEQSQTQQFSAFMQF